MCSRSSISLSTLIGFIKVLDSVRLCQMAQAPDPASSFEERLWGTGWRADGWLGLLLRVDPSRWSSWRRSTVYLQVYTKQTSTLVTSHFLWFLGKWLHYWRSERMAWIRRPLSRRPQHLSLQACAGCGWGFSRHIHVHTPALSHVSRQPPVHPHMLLACTVWSFKIQ